MSILVTRAADGYRVEGDPAPRSPSDLMELLTRRGWHSTDITDALDAADAAYLSSGATGPSWSMLHDAELRQRRTSHDI